MIMDIIFTTVINHTGHAFRYNSDTGEMEHEDDQLSKGAETVKSIESNVGLLLSILLIVLILRTRMYIRNIYSIPGNCCKDCCAAFWCSMCTVCQMARHTADYYAYDAACCTETGLPDHAPPFVLPPKDMSSQAVRSDGTAQVILQ
jgi:Cys-rich protein (TIGR01571 family)